MTVASTATGRNAVQAALHEIGYPEGLIQEQLEGGASTRQFFRVQLGERSSIAMYTPAPSQEIAKARQSTGYGSFVEVAELLFARELPVPKILAASQTSPVLFVEDLGNYTLAHYLAAHPHRKEALYRRAVATLARGQLALSPVPPGSVIGTRSFDYDLLHWEVEHFRQWAITARGIQLDPSDDDIFSRAAHFFGVHHRKLGTRFCAQGLPKPQHHGARKSTGRNTGLDRLSGCHAGAACVRLGRLAHR